MSRKPRADSILKTLPEDRQADIIAMIDKPRMTLDKAVAELAKDGIETSRTALSNFYSWWHLHDRLEKNRNAIETVLDSVKEEDPDLPPEKLFNIGQSLFSAMAIESQDPKVWAMTQKLSLADRQMDLERRKFERETAELFIKWSRDKRATNIVDDRGLTSDQKIDQVRALLFGEDSRKAAVDE